MTACANCNIEVRYERRPVTYKGHFLGWFNTEVCPNCGQEFLSHEAWLATLRFEDEMMLAKASQRNATDIGAPVFLNGTALDFSSASPGGEVKTGIGVVWSDIKQTSFIFTAFPSDEASKLLKELDPNFWLQETANLQTRADGTGFTSTLQRVAGKIDSIPAR